MRYYFIASVLIFLAPFFGEVKLDLESILNPNTTQYMLFWEVRTPRVLASFFAGATLALSGLIFQIIFRNSLTTPFTLGIASGSTLGVAMAVILFSSNFIYLFSFIGAISTVLTLYLISKKLKEFSSNSLLLVGVALSMFFSSILMGLYYISDFEQSYSIVRFTMGSLAIVGFEPIYILSLNSITLLLIILFYKNRLKYLLTSYESSFLKGIEVKRVNLTLLITLSISVAIVVSIVGPIGFIGLITPHIIKRIYRVSAEKLIFPTFFYGGVFLLSCDLLSRNLGSSSEIPIGVVTSAIGAPLFLYIILRR